MGKIIDITDIHVLIKVFPFVDFTSGSGTMTSGLRGVLSSH